MVDGWYAAITLTTSLATRCLTCCSLCRSLISNQNPVMVTRSYFFVNFVNFLFCFVNLFEIGQAMHLQIRPFVGYTAWYKTVRDESNCMLVTGPVATVRVQTRCMCNRHGALSNNAWFTLQLFFLIFYWTLRYCIKGLSPCDFDFHIDGSGLYTMLVITPKDSKTSKHVSILYQL